MYMRRTTLISVPSDDRIHFGENRTYPRIGDIVVLDQGFIFPDGKPGTLVYCLSANGDTLWGAEVYDSELSETDINEDQKDI